MKAQSLVFLLGLLAFAASAQPVPTSVSETYPIWPAVAPGMVNPPKEEPPPDSAGSYVGVVRPMLVMSLAANANGAAVLILPGGGYKKIARADTDGVAVARWLNSLGVDAYVLKYRLPMEMFNPPAAAYQDAQRALRLIRSNKFAGEFGHKTDPHRIGVIGFSAGGHLAGVMGTYYSTIFYPPLDDYDRIRARPDFMILGSAAVVPHTELRTPAGGHSPAARRWLQIAAPYPFDTAVNAQTPAAFIFHGQADRKVPVANAVAVAGWLEKAKVPVELHVFPKAGHDISIASRGAEKNWMALCEQWLRAVSIIP